MTPPRGFYFLSWLRIVKYKDAHSRVLVTKPACGGRLSRFLIAQQIEPGYYSAVIDVESVYRRQLSPLI
jgi:hypothetical protein